MPPYLPDANFFIEAHQLYRNEDDLKNWCEQNLPNDFFQDSAAAIEDYGMHPAGLLHFPPLILFRMPCEVGG